MLQNPKPEKAASRLRLSKKGDFFNQNSSLSRHQQHGGFSSLFSESLQLVNLTHLSFRVPLSLYTKIVCTVNVTQLN
jgi:hypothetical protein